MKYEIIEGEQAFWAFEPDYRSLYASSAASNPFNSPDWIYTWYAHHCDLGKPYVIAIYSDNGQHLLCVFALFRIAQARHVQSRRIIPMAYNSADYLEPLVGRAGDAVIPLLVCAITQLLDDHRCVLAIPQIPEAPAQSLRDALSKAKLYYVEKRSSVSPYIQLTGTFTEFLATKFKPKTRQTFRRKERRLRDCGKVAIKVAQTDNDLNVMLPAIADIEAQSWKGDENIGLFSSPRAIDFYTAALKTLAINGQARISILTIEDDPIAYEVALLSSSSYMMYGTGYLPEYRQYSPGTQLMLTNVEYAFNAGYRIYDFMCGNEEYKFQWSTHSVYNRSISVFRSDLRGWLDYRATATYVRLRSLAKRLVKG